MKVKLIALVLILFVFTTNIFAYQTIKEFATKAGGYDIPITVCIPENISEKMPVIFFVHGGGWNGGNEKEVPDASIPADCQILCDKMGIIYVGLAYRCKGNKGTFNLALQDLEASIKWFEDRADKFNADMSRIGFGGGSAGTTLSAVLAQRYSNCKIYVGREGMYNVLDLDSTLSNFPNSQSRTDFGLVSYEQKLEASPFYNLRDKPAAALLLHGKDDWLCHPSQSIKYAEQLKKAGGKCKVVLYEGINHTCLNISYPDVYKNSILEIARLYAEEFNIANVDFRAIEADLETRTKNYYPYDTILPHKLLGTWESSRYGTIVLNENGEGKYVDSKGTSTKAISYNNNGSWFSVLIESEQKERIFYLRKNDHTIYELVVENNRWKSRRNDYRRTTK